MPHSQGDRLLPNEEFVRGDQLVSSDGRFRLEFDGGGRLRVRAFFSNGGPRDLFLVGPGIRLSMGEFIEHTSVQRPITGQPRLSDGQTFVWSASPLNYSSHVHNHALIMQSDGNFVLYGITVNGAVFANWASLRGDQLPDRSSGFANAVIPNSQTVTFPPGTLILGAGQGQGEVLNNSGSVVGMRSGQQFVKVENGQTVSSTVPAGEVAVDTYSFTETSVTHHNDDATGVSNDRGRWRLSLVGGRLRLLSPGLAPPGEDIAVDLSQFRVSSCEN